MHQWEPEEKTDDDAPPDYSDDDWLEEDRPSMSWQPLKPPKKRKKRKVSSAEETEEKKPKEAEDFKLHGMTEEQIKKNTLT